MCKGAYMLLLSTKSHIESHNRIGEELDNFLKKHSPFDRVIYVGDGANDFCPVVRLRE